jgi:glyoxylase-like metal-dependent hydrolase (beta-lactamase superfamily II)
MYWGKCCTPPGLSLIGSWLVVLCLAVATAMGAASAQPAAGASAARPTVVPVEVAPRVWMVQGESALGSSANRNFISNAAFVVGDDRVIVFDALGSPALAVDLLSAIARITPLPVRHVVVTHWHADHVYGLQAFKAVGAEILGHADARLYLNSDLAAQRLKASREELWPWIDENTQLLGADRWITGPERLVLGGVELRLYPAGPAHTPEDLVVVLPDRRVLIAGDLVFRGRVPFVGGADSARWIESLDRLLAYDVAVIVPGHGPASTGAREDLQLTRDYLMHLRRTMGEAARALEPFEDAYARADWSRFEHLPLFKAANRINAYNTYLLMEKLPP